MKELGLEKENLEQGIKFFWEFLPSLVSAIILLVVGLWVIRFLTRLLREFFDKKDYDLTLEKFLVDLTNWGLKLILFILIITQLGVQTTSLVATLGAAGLAIGLALQGSLANFAGGVLILLFRPFKVGDFIAAQGADGTVKEISIFNTKLTTFGNQQVIIPNGKLSNDKITNFTVEGKRRDNIKIGVSYNDDIKKAKDLLLNLITSQENVMKDEDSKPVVVVDELGDSAVVLSLRFWALNEHFWDIHFYVLEEAKIVLESNGISIPFPQRDVHIFNQ